MAEAPLVDAAPGDAEAVAAEAGSAVGRWSPIVGMVPSLASRASRSEPLRHLVIWYEQVAADPETAGAPPVEGIDALVDELTSAISSETFDRLGRARWAVRVAENLVGLRTAQLPAASPAMARVASARLELVLTAARRQLDASPSKIVP